MSEQTDSEGLPIERRTYLTALAAGTATVGATAGAAAGSGGALTGQDIEDSDATTQQNGDLASTAVGYGYPLETESDYDVGYGDGLYGDVGPPQLPDGTDLPVNVVSGATDPEEYDLFEDILGNSDPADPDFGISEVQYLFDNLDNEDIGPWAPFFNFSGLDPTQLSIFDVQGLFNRLQDWEN